MDGEQRRGELMATLGQQLASGEELDCVTWPIARLHALRDERLRAVVAYARVHSRWHAERLRDIDVDSLTAATIHRLPVMTKADLREHWDDIVCDHRLTQDGAREELARLETSEGQPIFWHDDFIVMSTGGSSGVPTIVPWDVDGWMTMCAIVMRYGAWLQRAAAESAPSGGDDGAAPPMTTWVQATIGSSHQGSMSRRLALFLQNPMVQNHELPANASVADTVATLAALQPNGLFGYSTALTMVAREARAGRLQIAPQMVGASSEPLTEPMAAYLAGAFGVEPSNTYAVTEIGALTARDFPGTPGLGLIEDLAVYEPMCTEGDGGWRAAHEGEWSDALVVTNVLNRAMPLLRYAVEDRVIIDAEGTGGPWTGRRIRLGSRTFAPLAYGELRIDPGPLLERVLATPGALDAALTQTKQGLAVEVWFGDAGADPAAVATLQRDLAAALADAGLSGAEVEVVATDDPATLPRTPAGKRKPVVARA
jgi:phenylacetate-coenzyme A ligase PaaK-like adenylate-forming protein